MCTKTAIFRREFKEELKLLIGKIDDGYEYIIVPNPKDIGSTLSKLCVTEIVKNIAQDHILNDSNMTPQVKAAIPIQQMFAIYKTELDEFYKSMREIKHETMMLKIIFSPHLMDNWHSNFSTNHAFTRGDLLTPDDVDELFKRFDDYMFSHIFTQEIIDAIKNISSLRILKKANVVNSVDILTARRNRQDLNAVLSEDKWEDIRFGYIARCFAEL